MIDGQPREGAPLAALAAQEVRDGPRTADEERQQAARERDDREMGGRRLEDLERQRVAARGLRVRAEQRVAASTTSASAATRADGVDDDERDVLAQRRAQASADERVGDDHGRQHDRERIELRAREHRQRDRQPRRAGRVRPTAGRRRLDREQRPDERRIRHDLGEEERRERDPGHGHGRDRDDERAASAFASRAARAGTRGSPPSS